MAETKGFVLADFLAGFFRSFEGMPHRGSGTYYEARAARMLGDMAKKRFHQKQVSVLYEPLAVDLSSGAWNVAVHGWILFLSLLVAWGVGALVACFWSPGRHAVSLGLLGSVPFAAAAATALASAVVVWSRFLVGKSGWNLTSWFWPKADGANVIVTNLEELTNTEVPGALPSRYRDNHPADYWKKRFEKAKAEGGMKRIVVFCAHYDSARSLPPQDGPSTIDRLARFLTWLFLNRGIGLWPTIASVVLGVISVAAALGGFIPAVYGIFATQWFGAIILAVIILSAAFVLLEALVATMSSQGHYCPGFNDDLSGVAAIYGALSLLLEPGSGRSQFLDYPSHEAPAVDLAETGLIAALTCAEENGLRGSMVFAHEILAAAFEVFGKDRVFLINIDSISGGQVRASPWEASLTGVVREGNLQFARTVVDELAEIRLAQARVRKAFGKWNKGTTALTGAGPYGYNIGYVNATERLPACTDLTGFTSPPGLEGKLCAFSFVSSANWDDESLHEPRDYHQPSDGPETLFAPDEPDNFATVVEVALALEDIARLAAAGRFDLILPAVQFSAGSESLASSEAKKLESILEELAKHKEGRIIVAGHSAGAGKEKGDALLAQQRASAVAEHLLRHDGTLRARVIVEGHAHLRPLAHNAKPAGRARNRRVEIRLR